ncbi:hypothetical protein HK098_008306 [Nowakowskiella sp. JEL0407]|nr:hypothetical protein HK098_008306 [Nowakowskiella sp. JEL0407]
MNVEYSPAPVSYSAPPTSNFSSFTQSQPSIPSTPSLPSTPAKTNPLDGYIVKSEDGGVPPPVGYIPSQSTIKIIRVKAKDADKFSSQSLSLPSLPTTTAQPGVGTTGAELPEKKKKKVVLRSAGGEVWEDQTLLDWDPDDYRIFCGDLGNEVSDEMLAKMFTKYPSFQKARVLRDKKSTKSKGFGFVSFKDPNDFVAAMREMNGKYCGSRPMKLRKSNWKDRSIDPKGLKKGGGISKK